LVGGFVEELVEGLGEPEVEGGASRLGREEEVGVMMEELVRRRKGAEGSRGEAIVDMAVGGDVAFIWIVF
jgi:hypothetical protein